MIEKQLSEDMEAIDKWCRDNELILNLKKGKTETIMFGTKQMLFKHKDELKVSYQNKPVSTCVTYKYLGITIGSSLNFNSNVNISFKKASGRLRLLTKLRPMLTLPAARTIYQAMVVPILAYASLSTLKLNITNERKLDKLHSRATRVIACNRNPLQSICGIKKTKACLFVCRCLDDDVSEKFRNYFSVLNGATTRNQNCLLRLPPIKKEYFRGSFKYMGAKLYNDLHTSIRKTQNFDELKSLVKS